MPLLPQGDKLVVKQKGAEDQSRGGVLIPEIAKDRAPEGTVLAVGPGRRDEKTGEVVPVKIKVGDKVIFSKYTGSEIKYEGEQLLIVSEKDVLAVIQEHSAECQV